MTALADTALAFAREMLGWEYPVDRASVRPYRGVDGKANSAWEPYLFCRHGLHSDFYYADLGTVLQAVRTWCDEHESAVELAYYGYSSGVWDAEVGTPISVERITDPDPCIALMVACLDASRKLKP